jgi:hypothetical protein
VLRHSAGLQIADGQNVGRYRQCQLYLATPAL